MMDFLININVLSLCILFGIVICGVLIVKVLGALMVNIEELKKPTILETCRIHDWYELVGPTGETCALICNTCKKTPAMIQQEMDNE